ncbi:MAG: urease accessory protein UreD [Sedimentitalea sp.]
MHHHDGANRIARLRQSGALKLVFPRPRGAALDAIVVNTAGGITGGDQFTLRAKVSSGAELTISTQASERAYRAQPGETGRVRTHLRVAAGARLNWVPQETILFRKCALERRLQIDLEQGARLLMVEPLVFGRAAMGETLDAANFDDRITLRRDGVPLYLDGTKLTGDVSRHLARPAVADGAGAMASLVYVAPDAPEHLTVVRERGLAASLLGPDMLVLRAVAPDSHLLRQSLLPVLDHLMQNTLPLSWRL